MAIESTTAAAASSPLAALTGSAGQAAAAASSSKETASADRFLTLLVAQLKNQDPLDPMDNAQVTSQMAQINTVTGIEKLNATVASLSSQFTQSQALQGASLVGRDVVVAGDKLALADGSGQGGFELAGAADEVKVEVLSGAGSVLDSLPLGALPSGMHQFDWPAGGAAADAGGLRFRVVAKSGAATVAASPLMRDTVESVAAGADGLRLALRKSGEVAYTAVKSIH